MRRYASINYSSSEYWTDGYRENSLTPNDRGLRRCACGNYVLRQELIVVGHVTTTDVPSAPMVGPEELPRAITESRDPAIKLVARLDYWQHLNHPYRELYRAHRAAEDAAHQAAWEASNPDQRTPVQRSLNLARNPKYTPPADRPITFPHFELSAAQRENMMEALSLIFAHPQRERYTLESVELHRELAEFNNARLALQAVDGQTYPTLHRLTASLIDREVTAVVRYRM